ncbi:hypothetical protein ACH5RR_026454 [Cinchona calisaya]|uniref:Uncharacterized protein n=1 Tax=Cinchona calisaya TaxID=153742 RepID=A0ABD2Z6K5_9GENT
MVSKSAKLVELVTGNCRSKLSVVPEKKISRETVITLWYIGKLDESVEGIPDSQEEDEPMQTQDEQAIVQAVGSDMILVVVDRLTNYAHFLSMTSHYTASLPYSMLKRSPNGAEVRPMLSQITGEGMINVALLAILDNRTITKKNTSVKQVLVQWEIGLYSRVSFLNLNPKRLEFSKKGEVVMTLFI